MLLDGSLWRTIVQDDFVGNIEQLYTPNKAARRSEPFVFTSPFPIQALAATLSRHPFDLPPRRLS
jgi:hypothetical protein